MALKEGSNPQDRLKFQPITTQNIEATTLTNLTVEAFELAWNNSAALESTPSSFVTSYFDFRFPFTFGSCPTKN